MENSRDRLFTILGVTLFLIICGLAFYFVLIKDYTFYAQIDNTKIKEISSSDNMKYEYTLTMYEESGFSKKIKFKASRELREGAYLKFKYYMVSGVNKWEEVQYDELPESVKKHYKK